MNVMNIRKKERSYIGKRSREAPNHDVRTKICGRILGSPGCSILHSLPGEKVRDRVRKGAIGV
jgi:hypothetical protein